MKLCIVEKLSVVCDIVEVFGVRQCNDGFYEGNGYWVIWIFGYFCMLKELYDYWEFWKYWWLEDLFMILEKFGIKFIEDNGVKK